MQQHSRDWLILAHAHLRVPELERLLRSLAAWIQLHGKSSPP